MGFWTETGTNLGRDPKRGFRFIVQITNIGGGATTSGGGGTPDGGILWYAKTVDKPSFEISTTEHNYLNHKFNYPGRTTWSPVALKVVDPTSPDMAATFSDIITAAGYHPPANMNDHTSMQKALATTALGNVVITQIDADGQPLEKWTLWNAWISKVNYGSLDYSSDDLTEMEIELVYDWAQLETLGSTSYGDPGGAPGSPAGNKFFQQDGSSDPNPSDGGGPGFS